MSDQVESFDVHGVDLFPFVEQLVPDEALIQDGEQWHIHDACIVIQIADDEHTQMGAIVGVDQRSHAANTAVTGGRLIMMLNLGLRVVAERAADLRDKN